MRIRALHGFRAGTTKREQFGEPRFFVRVAALEVHPLDGISRAALLKNELGFDALLKQVRRIQGAGSVRK
jgi:hypothetical protein